MTVSVKSVQEYMELRKMRTHRCVFRAVDAVWAECACGEAHQLVREDS